MHGGKQDQFRRYARSMLAGKSPDQAAARLAKSVDPYVPYRPSTRASPVNVRKLLAAAPPHVLETLLDPATEAGLAGYGRNIENCIGTVKVPVGLIGPLRVNGLHARGDYPVPLATTEAALVASYHRGACLLGAAGGCSALLVHESVTRAPAFVFTGLAEAARFLCWVLEDGAAITEIAESTSSHARLVDLVPTVEGNHVYLTLEFSTGDASGQNMVTMAAEAVCEHIRECSPVTPLRIYTEGNFSGDKKASARAFTSTRGKKVTAEAVIPAELVQKFLHVTPGEMVDYWRVSAIGGVLSGTMGVQGHFANGLAALYLATGQDVACVAESAVGITRFEETGDHALRAAVTLPGIMVGTIGGGTGLPSQHACLALMGLAGEGKARALAEVCAGLLLAGELSIIGALAAGQFARAHKKLARQRPSNPA